MSAIGCVQIEQAVAQHRSQVSIHHDDQERVETSGPDQDLIETFVSIPIHVLHVVEAGQAQGIEIEAVDIRPDVQARLRAFRHIAHWLREACLKFLEGQ